MLAPTRLAKCSMDKQAQSCFVKSKTVNNEMCYTVYVVRCSIYGIICQGNVKTFYGIQHL